MESLTKQQHEILANDSVAMLHQTQELLLQKLASQNEDVRLYAAFLLGEYRFPQAAETLSKSITMQNTSHGAQLQKAERLWDRFPAAEALIKIGNPSIPYVIRNLAESDMPLVRELSLTVLTHIDDNKDITLLRLQKAATSQTDSGKREKVKLAIESLKNLP